MSSNFKDHFSTQSSQYQRFRPSYPDSLFAWFAQQTPGHDLAWDCATGSGQAARALADHFDRVIATDASANQIAHCTAHPRVDYRVAAAEQSPLADTSCDLITVAQALHWFRQDEFFKEASRVLKANGVLAVWSYNLLSINAAVDEIVQHYYQEIVGPYWPPERSLVEQGYSPLPSLLFDEIKVPAFAMTTLWSLDDLLGYLGTWSASVRYAEAQQHDPLTRIHAPLTAVWGDPQHKLTVNWPLHIRTSRKHAISP